MDESANREGAVNQDELIQKKLKEIETEINQTIPLISEPIPLITLDAEYQNDNVYMSKVNYIKEKYDTIRKVRPDGNCFFRAFGFSCLEYLIKNKKDYDAFKQIAINSKEKLVKLGFPQFTIEDFHDTFMEVIERVKPSDSDPNKTESGANPQQELHRLFNEQGYSDYVVVFLRLITSGQLQEGADFYLNFIDGNLTMAEFCHQEVEPMYKESDHIHIIAICSALNIGVRVEYMDRGEGQLTTTNHDFPDGLDPKVFLLYRPSHYDILYPKEH
jgi:ubiquitin thioesterase protein OTUB1